METEGIRHKAADRRRESKAIARCERILTPVGRPIGHGRLVEDVGHGAQALRRIAAGVARPRAGPAGVLPLGLGRQAVADALFLRQPTRHRHRVVPGDVDNGMIFALGKTRISPGILRVTPGKRLLARRVFTVVRRIVTIAARPVAHRFRCVTRLFEEAPELPDRHFGPAQVEILGDAHAMNGAFIVNLCETVLIVLWKGSRHRFHRLVAAHQELTCRHAHENHAQRIGQAGIASRHGRATRQHTARQASQKAHPDWLPGHPMHPIAACSHRSPTARNSRTPPRGCRDSRPASHAPSRWPDRRPVQTDSHKRRC